MLVTSVPKKPGGGEPPSKNQKCSCSHFLNTRGAPQQPL
uniref:Uncharacterized protein n=1 Tax=Anguilla anguilla TaxID=7936 RepID=A0A0E9VCP0_ANGAN